MEVLKLNVHEDDVVSLQKYSLSVFSGDVYFQWGTFLTSGP